LKGADATIGYGWQRLAVLAKTTLEVGAGGEDKALRYLEAQGLTLITRNFRCKSGEIDLIMQQKLPRSSSAQLVFVEVRLRTHSGFGGAAASVGIVKQRRLRIAAEFFLLKTYGASNWPATRFDVVAFEPNSVNWIEGAF
jgi:putative endonuclease